MEHIMTSSLWVLASVVLLLLAVAAELAARWWLRHRSLYYVFPPGLRLRLHPDPEVFPQLEPLVRFEVNSHGERGGEGPRLRSGARLYRALVAGGSPPESYLPAPGNSGARALPRPRPAPEHLQ